MSLVDPIRIVVHGNPPRKDAYFRTAPGRNGGFRLVLSQEAKAWSRLLGAAWMRLRRDMVTDGRWELRLTIYVTKSVRRGADVFPMRDCDSSISPVLDALQREGVIDNDIRIAPIHLYRDHDPKCPRTVIDLMPVALG